jgi:hypothetical protein
MDVASLIREISGNNTAAVGFIHYSNKVILYSGSNDVGHIGEEFLNSL